MYGAIDQSRPFLHGDVMSVTANAKLGTPALPPPWFPGASERDVPAGVDFGCPVGAGRMAIRGGRAEQPAPKKASVWRPAVSSESSCVEYAMAGWIHSSLASSGDQPSPPPPLHV